MIDLIETVLFSDIDKQRQFMLTTDRCHEPILGDTFHEKLHYLLQHGSEESVQSILAPYLREAVYHYLITAETPFAQATKSEFIKCSGESLYDEQVSNYYGHRIPSQIYFDFKQLRTKFIHERGTQIWESMIKKNQNDSIENRLWAELKSHFFERLSSTIPATFDTYDTASNVWDYIHNHAAAIQDFMHHKHLFSQTWGEEQSPELWALCDLTPFTALHTLPAIPEEDRENEEESLQNLGFPEPPSLEQDFKEKKEAFVQKYSLDLWKKINKLPSNALVFSAELKRSFIEAQGQKQWNRIYRAPAVILAFDAVKNGFIEKRGKEAWRIYSQEEEMDTLDPVIIADFKERKKQFVDHWTKKGYLNAWEESKEHPAIPYESLVLLNRLKTDFIQGWGQNAWLAHLSAHRGDAYAENVQLETLGELFDFRVEVTDIRGGQQRTTMPLRRTTSDRPTVHFFCKDNIHYFVHVNGYYDTSGHSNNCAYHGFSQWLKFLFLGVQPRRLHIIPPSHNIDSSIDALVQNALDQRVSAEHSFSEEQDFHIGFNELTIRNIRIELALTLQATPQQLARFIQIRSESLIQIITAKKLPSNRNVILQKITALATEFGEQGQYAELLVLQKTLLYIANSLYLPNTQDVSSEWTRQIYEANIQELQASVPTMLPAEQFSDLGALITTTNFANNPAEQNSFTPTLIWPQTSYQFNHRPPSITPEEDWLSTILWLGSILILITGISCLAALLCLALISGPTQLGLLLMQYGFQVIATNLGAILGLAAPHAAVLAAGIATTMVTGLGFNFFQEFAPSSIVASSTSLLSTLRIF